jgi:hypothetical protein
VILADNALLAALVSGATTIGPEIIDKVVKDRGLPDTQPPPPPRSIKKHKAESRISSLRRAGLANEGCSDWPSRASAHRGRAMSGDGEAFRYVEREECGGDRGW